MSNQDEYVCIEDFKDDFYNLFRKYNGNEIVNRGSASSKFIHQDSILFIGLNPSFTKGATNGSFFYDSTQAKAAYFKKFNEIAEEVGLPWSHLDLLTVRETKQKKVEKLPPEFINAHLKISKGILERSKPIVIVVENSLARTYFGKGNINGNGMYSFEFDDSIGTDRIISDSNLKNLPVFFTSMLTGQRALDLGSLERLKWHIKQVVNQR